MPHNIVTMRNIGCTEHCAKLCDKAFGDIHYASAEWEEGNKLHIDLGGSIAAIIPAFHILEHYRSLGYPIGKVYLAKFNGEIENGIGDTEITDISGWSLPKGRNYLILNKRKSVYAGDLLNAYNAVLDKASASGVNTEFPYDLLVKGASSKELSELCGATQGLTVPYVKDDFDLGLGFMREFLDVPEGQEITRKVDALPMYHLRQKVRIKNGNGA